MPGLCSVDERRGDEAEGRIDRRIHEHRTRALSDVARVRAQRDFRQEVLAIALAQALGGVHGAQLARVASTEIRVHLREPHAERTPARRRGASPVAQAVDQ